MSKTLMIVRHGKSSWDDDELDDMDRPLAYRGVINAYDMAKRLVKENILPDFIISSPAIRALHTCVIFAKVMKVPFSRININQMLYFSSFSEIFGLIKETNNEVSRLMIFGHNPTFTNFANIFVKNYIDNIPTAGVVILNFSCTNWKEISKNNLETEYFDFPKNK